jgi:hypothetical protein
MDSQHSAMNFAVICLLLCSLGVPLHMLAQGGATGAISGTVLDSSGAVIPNAKVDLVSAGTGAVVRTEATNASGLFYFTLLPVDMYTVQIEAPGFGRTTLRDVGVRVTETTRLTVALKPQTTKEMIEVQSEPATVKTTDATTGESMTGQTIRELPLATRNFQQLLATNAGASSSLNSAAQLGRGDVRINVNGGREDNNNYQIDGIGTNDPTNAGELAYTPLPSPDSIQEFKVSTSLYDATQGRNGGGNINAVLKSGTMNYHFDGFEYFRNTVLDANDFFLKGQGLDRPVIKQNIFGGSVGGPIGRQAKLGFFFVNYQGTRQQSGDSPGAIISTIIPFVPAADRVAGNAAATQTLLQNDPNCGASQVDSVAAGLLSIQSAQFGSKSGGFLFPLPPNIPASTPCGSNVPFAVSKPGKFTDNQFTANWDREFHGGQDHIAERFFYSNARTSEPFGADGFQLQTGYVPSESNLNFALNVPVRDRFGSVSWTHLFSSRLINEARFGVAVIGWKLANLQPTDLGNGNPVNINDFSPAIVRPSTAGVSTDLPRIQINALGLNFGPHPTTPLNNLSDTYSFLDTISFVRGKHSLRFGGQVDHTDIRKNIPVADNGFWFVNTFQDFLTGNLAFALTQGGLSNHDYHIVSFSGFFQDDYRATRSLTLNLGLRAEILGAPSDKLCHIANIDLSLSDPNSPNFTGQPFVYPKCATQLAPKLGLTGITGTRENTGLNDNYARVWAPRIGFAYDVGGKQTTSIRGGYGLYAIREDAGGIDNMTLLPPFAPGLGVGGIQNGGLANLYNTTLNPNNGLPPVGSTSQAFVPIASKLIGPPNQQCDLNTAGCFPAFSGDIPFFSAFFVPAHWVVPTMQQWNFGVQQAIGRSWTVEVGYVGTKGTHLRVARETNQPRVASPSNPVVVPTFDPNTGQKDGTISIKTNTVANAAARAPFQGIFPANVQEFAPVGNSVYHGLQATVLHRFAGGLYLQSAYTYAKSIDDTSTSQVAFISRFNDQTNARASRSLSDYDRKHRWINTFTYSLPFFAHRSGAAHAALGGWDISGVVTLQSGTPFSVTDSLGGAAFPQPAGPILVTPTFAQGFNCSNAFTSGSTISRINGYLNRAAFVNDAPLDAQINNPLGVQDPSATGFGNVPRNCFRGPRQFNTDFSVGKVFRISERQSLKFTAEFFNLTNSTSFQNPVPGNNVVDINSVAPTSPTFGQITSIVGTPRLIQFALRYSF